jgi:Spy/CpxP family protein refolding chaperone
VRAGSKSQRDVRQELRALRTETDQEMAKVLSADQQAKYEEMRREERRDGRGGGRQGGGRQADSGGPQ